MLAELRTERDQLDEAILNLAAPRGRPWQASGPSAEVDGGSEAARQAADEQEQGEGRSALEPVLPENLQPPAPPLLIL